MAKRQALGGKLRSTYQESLETAPPLEAGEKPKRYLPRELRKVAFWMRPELVDRARDAVYACGAEHLTLTAFAANAFEAEIARLAKRHNKGKPFPRRPAGQSLTPGARPK